MPVSDCFADSGIEDGDVFTTLWEAGLSGANEFPYKSGIIEADRNFGSIMNDLVKPVKAITMNTATGSLLTKERLVSKYNPDIETMEGATFFYICAREAIPFMALRAISNRIERRNRESWNIPLALDALSEKFKEVILRLETKT
jgi:futalosine hydrolase